MSRKRGFTPLHPESPAFQSGDERKIGIKPLRNPRSLERGVTGFTLVELILVIVLIGILAALAIPDFNRAKEKAIGKEAITNLKLIRAAEKIYRMDSLGYYPMTSSASTVDDIAEINTNLKLFLTEGNWNYSITGDVNSFTAYSDRNGVGGYLDCLYSIRQDQNEPLPVDVSKCP